MNDISTGPAKDTPTRIREAFLQFWRERDHRILPSAPLVPKDDPTLLFTSAGMVQFKKYYASREPLEFRRAVTIQKCLRASDLEEVGHTPRHLTFFEMLGHFSFGDYFKREAVRWNWEFFTRVFALPVEKLKVSVYEEDDEAFAIWRDDIGLPSEKIYRLGKKDNFWGPAGDTGACGPNTEVYYDLGEDLGCGRPDCGPGCDCNRWIEVGNVVFPQFDMQKDGTLAPLANRGIDTGIGLERLAMVVEGKRTLFESGAFRPIIRVVEEMSGRRYEGAAMPAFNIIADHIRALTFALTERILPSNEGRGYVIRRLLRRAAVQGHRLGLDRPFLFELSAEVVKLLGPAYPELREAAPSVRMALELEEERFQATLAQGLSRFEEAASRSGRGGVIAGDEVFLLYDTYGFPTDLTDWLARERGLRADLEGFVKAMEEQKVRSRRSARFYQSAGETLEWTVLSEGPHSVFRGYETLELDVRIRRFAPVESEFWVVLDETPFYAESGGQVGDQGVLEAEGFRGRVLDTRKHDAEIRHRVQVEEGVFPDAPIHARVLESARWDTMRNHTATHLLHAALRRVLGPHVTQSGSLVAPDRLRFDFTHARALTHEEIARVEDIVNERILFDDPVVVRESAYADAIGEGVMALFGEKYGDRVRRVEVGDFSRELCGGTHVARTGQIGAFVIRSEGGIAAGIRRIEALTGRGSVREFGRLLQFQQGALKMLPGVPEELGPRIQALQQEASRLRKQIQELKEKGPQDESDALFQGIQRLPGGACLTGRMEAEEGSDLRALGDRIRKRLGTGAALVAIRAGKKTTLLAIVTDDLVEQGRLKADLVVREAASAVGGSGGGRPHLAMAGMGDPERTDEAIEAGRRMIAAALGG